MSEESDEKKISNEEENGVEDEEKQVVERKQEKGNQWDDLGKRLVEARKVLDLAKQADEEAAEALKLAQEKKAQCAKEYQTKSNLVKQLAAEFTSALAGNFSTLAQNSHNITNNSSSSSISVPTTVTPTTHQTNGSAGSKRFRTIAVAKRGNPTSPNLNSVSDLSNSKSGEATTTTETRRQSRRTRSNTSDAADEFESNNNKTIVLTALKPTSSSSVSSSSSKKKKGSSYGKSIYRGVRKLLSDGSYEARISINGTDMLLGRFPTEEEAAKCYDNSARKHRKGALILNFLTDQDRESGAKSVFELKRRAPK